MRATTVTARPGVGDDFGRPDSIARRPRSRAALTAVVVGTVGALALAGCGRTVATGDGTAPPKLRLGTQTGAAGAPALGAGDAAPGSRLSAKMWWGSGFVIRGELPSTPTSAAVWRWVSGGKATEADVRALARGFGISAAPVRKAYGWIVRDAAGELRVRDGDGNPWAYGRPSPDSTCPTVWLDVEKADQSGDSVACAVTPPADGAASPAQVSTADVTIAADRVRQALTGMGALGGGTDDRVRVDSFGEGGWASIEPRVAGLPTSGLEIGISVDARGIATANGRLALPGEGDVYPLLTAAAALTRLQSGPAPLGAPEARSSMPCGVLNGGPGLPIVGGPVTDAGPGLGMGGGSTDPTDPAGLGSTAKPGMPSNGEMPMGGSSGAGSTGSGGSRVSGDPGGGVDVPNPPVGRAPAGEAPAPPAAPPVAQPPAPTAKPDPNFTPDIGSPIPCPTPEPAVITGATIGLSLGRDGGWPDGEDILVPAWFYTVEDGDYPLVSVAVDPAYVDGGTDPSDPSATPDPGNTGGVAVPPTPEPPVPAPTDPATDPITDPTTQPTTGPQPTDPVATPEPLLTDPVPTTTPRVTRAGVYGYWIAGDGRTLTLDAGGWGPACATQAGRVVSQDEKAVVVTVDETLPERTCTDPMDQFTVTVTLDAPLGSRVVLDVNGAEVPARTSTQ